VLLWLQQERIIVTCYTVHTAQGAQLQSMLTMSKFPADISVLQLVANATSTLQLMLKAQGSAQCSIPHLVPLLHAVQHRHQTVLTELEVRRL
jgi:hypothetical protein